MAFLPVRNAYTLCTGKQILYLKVNKLDAFHFFSGEDSVCAESL